MVYSTQHRSESEQRHESLLGRESSRLEQRSDTGTSGISLGVSFGARELIVLTILFVTLLFASNIEQFLVGIASLSLAAIPFPFRRQ